MTNLGAILIRPALPVWLIVLTVIAVAISGWLTYRHCPVSRRERLLLWGLRMGALLVLAFLLLLPEHRTVKYDHEAPVLAVVLDVSASMTERLDAAAPSRSERALDLLTDRRLARLAEKYRLFRYEIGADVRERTESGANLLFNAPRSNISSAINRIADRLHADNVAGILLLTDGLDHSAERFTPQTLSVPVFVPELEDPYEIPSQSMDYWIGEISYPKMMVVHWKGKVEVVVRRSYAGDRAAFPVHFRQEQRLLRTSLVEFQQGERFKQVSFVIEPQEMGQILYEVQIEPSDDANKDNNQREFLIQVTDPRNRVLYLEGFPRWEFKFLKRALLAEDNYQLSAFVQGAQASFINFSEEDGMSGAALPAIDTDTLAQYKVVILGDLPASALTENAWKSVQDFVDKGGGLLLMGAARAYGADGLQQAPHVAELLPGVPQPGSRMNEGRFSVDLTATGRVHPALTAMPRETQLPPVLSFFSPVQVREFSSTLIATADGSPLLSIRRFGQGRVAMVLSDSLWRWQLGALESVEEKSLYNTFITQLVHWLAPSEKDVEASGLLQLLVADNEVELRQEVIIGAVQDGLPETQNQTLNCHVTTPDGRRLLFPMVPATLGADVGVSGLIDGYKCRFVPQIPGRYHVSVSHADSGQEAKLLILAKEPENELTGMPLNRAFLQDVADQTGGRFSSWKNRHELLESIPYTETEIQLVEEYPIWNRWWWILLLVALFTAEWWWRRRLDLV